MEEQTCQQPKSIFQKIQDVSNEIKNIKKNMTVGNGSFSYKAVQDIDVILEVNKAETNNRIVSIPIKQELINSEIVKVIKDNGIEAINYVDVVKMTLRIINLDNPDEQIDIESFGRGLDSGDKGFGKASTYARKYALLNAYKIATGEDPDKDPSKDQNPAEQNAEKDSVRNYMMKDYEYCRNIMKHFNIETFDDLTGEQIKIIFNNLKKKNLI